MVMPLAPRVDFGDRLAQDVGQVIDGVAIDDGIGYQCALLVEET